MNRYFHIILFTVLIGNLPSFGQDFKSSSDSLHYYIYSGGHNIYKINSKDTLRAFQVKEEHFGLIDSLVNVVLSNQDEMPTFNPYVYNIKYDIQIISMVNQEDEIIIFLSAYCDEIFHSNKCKKKKTENCLKHTRIDVYDGGSCYWQMGLNLGTEKIDFFYVNGI